MAPKDKRKRRSTWTPPRTAAAPATRTDTSGEALAARQARREEAKLLREKLRRQAVRRRRVRRGLWSLAIVGVIAGIVVLVIATRPLPTASADERQDEMRSLAQAVAEAGCEEEIVEVPPALPDSEHVTELPPLNTYPSSPPASGPHFGVTLPAGFYDSAPELGRAIHSLEHGAVIVWYSPDADPERVDDLRYFLDGLDHVIVAPYSYEGEGGALPEGTEMTAVAWHKSRSCDEASPAVALRFARDLAIGAFPGADYDGDAPEAGSPI